ncbi:MAG: L,D-transpeptidase family protein [Verrucomicrobiota bacterium]|nr:L,D-transpeptidase family protein [Verrucomicrobiota bacterium]
MFLIILIFAVCGAVALFCLRHEWNALAIDAQADRILVEKAARRMTLFRGGTPLKIYRIALGRAPVGHKVQEGDQRTPEGIYSIDRRKPDSDFHRALHISYPSPDDVARARELGVEPGGDIMIHGQPNGRGGVGALHRARDWTAGCIALTDAQIEEIWRSVPDGTPIEIRP